MKIQDLQKSFKFYKINTKFNTLYPIFTEWWEITPNHNQPLQIKIKIFKSHSNCKKEIPSSTNDIQDLKMMGEYLNP
jgi:hypothetical protein